MTASGPTDSAIRERALDINTSFAVSAPAGSGKTGLLARRVLRLLAACETPEQILCITFTRKAAAEMQQRIMAALHRAQNDDPPSDHYQQQLWRDAQKVLQRDQQQNWQLLRAPQRLRILTIDGLCRYLARQLAVESGLGDVPEPLDYADTCYRQAVHNLVAELDSPSATGDSLARLLQSLDNDLPRLENLLVSLLARRDQWLGHILNTRDARQLLEGYLKETIEETLADAGAQLHAVGNELAALGDYAATNLCHLGSPEHSLCLLLCLKDLPPAKPEQLPQWQALLELLFTQSGAWRKTINKKSGFPTAKEAMEPNRVDSAKARWQNLLDWCQKRPGLQGKLLDIRHLPTPGFSDDQWQVLDTLTHLLPRLAAELSLIFRQQHRCDFTEITLGALKALGDDDSPTDLSLRLDHQIRHILVDEFQDTASVQFHLLKKLVSGWTPGDGRTLFIVGDGMQSLYGFRNANVGLFLEARQQPINQVVLEPLDISVNFRSDAGILAWVNQIFSQIFPPLTDISRGAVPYAPAIAARSTETELPVTLDCFPETATSAEEAKRVAEWVQQARHRDPQGTIAILARKRGQLTAILEELYRQGITWQATAIDPLASRMPVIDLMSLSRALLNPADRIAWLSILRAPWCGLSLHDLHALANTRLASNPVAQGKNFPSLPGQLFDPALDETLSKAGRLSLARTRAVLYQALHNRGKKPLRSWVEGTWLALGGPATLNSAAELSWCRQFFDLLENHAYGDSIRDPGAFEYAANNLYATAEAATDNPVQVMTIHKAKGLEFDTVIVPGLEQKGGGNNVELLYWRERLNRLGQPQLLISPPQAIGDEKDPLVAHLKREAQLKTELEDARVLYVACTRAIKRLHLLFRQPAKEPASGSLLKCLWPALAANAASEFRVQGSGFNVKEAFAPPALTTLLRLKPDWRFPESLLLENQQRNSSDRNEAMDSHLDNGSCVAPLPSTHGHIRGNNSDGATQNVQAASLGTILHRTLRQIVIEGLENWDQARQDRQREAWALQLRQLGLSASEAALNSLSRAIVNSLNDPQGRWLLDNKHPNSACELALGAAGINGEPKTWVIDRTFVAENTRWIIDYKMAEPQAGQPLAQFLQQQRELYQPQLESYARLFSQQSTENVTLALYFPLIPHLETYPDP